MDDEYGEAFSSDFTVSIVNNCYVFPVTSALSFHFLSRFKMLNLTTNKISKSIFSSKLMQLHCN